MGRKKISVLKEEELLVNRLYWDDKKSIGDIRRLLLWSGTRVSMKIVDEKSWSEIKKEHIIEVAKNDDLYKTMQELACLAYKSGDLVLEKRLLEASRAVLVRIMKELQGE
jgi:hypothetical protein